ncbi:MAG: hypothetical protein Tsb009_12660 [Planctomycetaceae bacterium]
MADEPLRCPTPVCIGWVTYIEDDDGNFWGCGECGEVWFSRKDLNAAIKEITDTYNYRKACYTKSGRNWVAADPANEPDDYEELVEDEDYPEDDDEDGDEPEDEDDSTDESDEPEWLYEIFCCPTWGCHGTVIWCEDGPDPDTETAGWYCEMCEKSWPTHENFFKAIKAIVKKAPHREQFYEQTDDGWLPVGDFEDWEKIVLQNEGE